MTNNNEINIIAKDAKNLRILTHITTDFPTANALEQSGWTLSEDLFDSDDNNPRGLNQTRELSNAREYEIESGYAITGENGNQTQTQLEGLIMREITGLESSSEMKTRHDHRYFNFKSGNIRKQFIFEV